MTGTFRVTLIALTLLHVSCAYRSLERRIYLPGEVAGMDRMARARLSAQIPFMKAHLKDGSLYVFSQWTGPDSAGIRGKAVRYDSHRFATYSGTVTLTLDRVALFETNRLYTSGSSGGLMLFTGASIAVSAYCAINPKACFGSCPTFYASESGSDRLVAEGFSASVAPALEATDVDALGKVGAGGEGVVLTMKNEAIETHVVRSVNLLKVRHPEGTSVIRTENDTFLITRPPVRPVKAVAEEGSVLETIGSVDGKERYSAADSSYLAAKETIELSFQVVPGKRMAVVLRTRQTLLSTFLFYQTLAYMGSDAGYWLARMNDPELRGVAAGLEDVMGGIEVWRVENSGREIRIGELMEHGPLAADVCALPIGVTEETTARLRLRMTKGMWRVDMVGLAEIVGTGEPERCAPIRVTRHGEPDADALSQLLDPSRSLVTMPGDEYVLEYSPIDEERETCFLESRGYYLEWMRESWLEEEDPELLTELFMEPEQALKRLAPLYKVMEPSMEETFWRSKYVTE